MNDDISKEQFDLWEDFKNQISYANRFVQHHKLLDRIISIVSNNVIMLSEDTSLYRARIYNGDVGFEREFEELIDRRIHPEKYEESEQQESNNLENIRKIFIEAEKRKKRGLEERENSGFWGYDELESFIPQNSDAIKDGRANPSRIKYLYVADQPNTALAEVRPLLKSYVSIAEIKVIKELKIANMSYDIFNNVSDEDIMLTYLIMEEFSKPNNNEPFDYLPTQFISEYIKNNGFDGIKYNSSLYGRGRNYVIFNYEKCKAISSKLFELHDICYDAKCIGPVGVILGEQDLFHWKLLPYKEESKKELLKKLHKETLEPFKRGE